MSLYAEVLLALPVEQTFTYRVPESCEAQAKVGSRVLVPFHQRKITGFIVGLRKRRADRRFELKEIGRVLDENPVFSSGYLSFTRKLSAYHYAPWGEVLQASLPPSLVPQSKTRIYLLEEGERAFKESSLSEKEERILRLLKKGPYSAVYLQRKCGIKNLSSILGRMEKKGLIRVQKEVQEQIRRKDRPVSSAPLQMEMDFAADEKSLGVADVVTKTLQEGRFSSFLLWGSPETREAVYFALIRNTLRFQKNVLFLVPEIAATEILRARFEKKLGENAVILHSRLSERQKESAWMRVKEDFADVVVGPRSALFSPQENLGLIIVDEEQDESYYQKESPSYDARKGAELRARQERAVLVMGSQAPLVESFFRAKKNRSLLKLEDTRTESEVSFSRSSRSRLILSDSVLSKIRERIENSEPVVVFFNRRGYASYLQCVRCSHVPRCTRCDIPMSYHRREKKHICHYCNRTRPQSNQCPECGNRLAPGRSYGIEAVEEELRKNFPQSSVVCFDTDAVKSRKDEERILSSFARGKIDILVGTQMLAHQTEFSRVPCVVVLSPETHLVLPDFRASQKTFQILTQMKKFLRDDEGSELVVQTDFPQHHSIRSAAFGDYESFYSKEMDYRGVMNYPPFSAVIEVVFRGENLRALAREARRFSARIGDFGASIEILGPALDSVSRIRGVHRIQVILKAKKKKILDQILKESLKGIRLRKSVRVYE